MLCNTDRSQGSEHQGHGVQVGYVLSGSSCKLDQMRKVLNEYYNNCIDLGPDVVAVAFDGKYHQYLTTSNEGKPLTTLALRKCL